MIGPDGAGNVFAVFIVEDNVTRGLWRPVTGRRATEAERDWWRGKKT